jgi:two-component system sensor histidine kinase YesM
MLFSLLIAIVPLLLVSGFSYVKSTAVIEEKVSLSNFQTVKQIADNINLMIEDMKSSATFLCQSTPFITNLKVPKAQILTNPQNYLLEAQHAVNNFVVFKTNIYSIYVNGFNGIAFDTASSTNVISPVLEKQLSELHGEGVMIADTVTNYNNSQTKVISFVKILKDIDDLSSDLAIIKINIQEDEISKVYQTKLLSHTSNFMIIDENSNIVSSLNKSSLGAKLDAMYDDAKLYQSNSGHFKAEIAGHPFIETYYDLSRPGWKLVNLVPLDELSHDAEAIRNFTLYAIIGSVVLCLLVILFFSYKVLSPLHQIRKFMKYVENEKFNLTIDVRGNDEIALIGESFNRMSRKLGELINEVYTVRIKQKEAELKALQAQINPHFLYNTLDTIYWMCRMEKANESSELVQALSKLFRLSLNSGNEFTTVGKEVEHLKYYLTIQEKRFADRIDFRITVSEEVLSCKVVKLILQPLVENAIHHGIEKKGMDGYVAIDIYEEEGTLLYTISDDGIGADESELNRLLTAVEEDNRGFGIKNVNDRIQLYFGQAYGIQFRTSPGKGTTVYVKQPFIRGGNVGND